MKVPLHPIFGTELPEEWDVVTVNDVRSPEPSSCVAGPFGSNIASKYFVEEGVPIIRGSNLRDDLTRFVSDAFAFVTPERAQSYRPQHVKAGDLVFTCWGSVGQVGLIPDDGPFPEYIISNKQLKLRPDVTKVDPEYLFYYFASPEMVAHIRNRAIGSAVPGINLGILKSLPVVLPPLHVQRAIATALSAYDDLIENNMRRIVILEEMARAIYREWFIEFRYPGHEDVPLVDSDLGPIPDGWEASTIGAISNVVTRGISPKYDDDSELVVINQKCIRGGRLSMAPARRHKTSVPTAKVVRFGDGLINSTGVGTLGRVAQVYEELPNVTVDSHVTIVRPDAAHVSIDYFGLTLLGREPEFAAMGAGSTGQTELSRARVSDTPLLVPSPTLQERFAEVVQPIRSLAMNLEARNATLRPTRDLLLPRLISGEVDVSDLELDVEDTAA